MAWKVFAFHAIYFIEKLFFDTKSYGFSHRYDGNSAFVKGRGAVLLK